MKPAVPLVVMALLASIVTGREQTATPEASQPAPVRAPQSLAAAPEALDLDKLVRSRQERSFQDLFASPSSAPAPVPAAPPPPAPAAVPTPEPAPLPSAPPLPFTYLGRMVKGDRTVAYVLKGDHLSLAEAGQALGEDYRVEGITDSAVHFVYLPLGTKQVLNLPVRE